MVLYEGDRIMKVGLINGNPLKGLCYRMCVETKQIFDGCRTEYPNLTLNLTIGELTGATTPPLTFVSVENSGPVSISNTVITPTEATNGNSEYRIDYDYTLPLIIRFVDATGLPGTASSSVTLHNTVNLRIPPQSLTPYSVDVWAALSGRIGTFNGTQSVSVQCCVILITKIVMIVDILIPSYGYCNYPECGSDSTICPGFANVNRFPPIR